MSAGKSGSGPVAGFGSASRVWGVVLTRGTPAGSTVPLPGFPTREDQWRRRGQIGHLAPG